MSHAKFYSNFNGLEILNNFWNN